MQQGVVVEKSKQCSIIGQQPTVKTGRTTLHLKKKIVDTSKLKELADVVNKRYGHGSNKK